MCGGNNWTNHKDPRNHLLLQDKRSEMGMEAAARSLCGKGKAADEGLGPPHPYWLKEENNKITIPAVYMICFLLPIRIPPNERTLKEKWFILAHDSGCLKPWLRETLSKTKGCEWYDDLGGGPHN